MRCWHRYGSFKGTPASPRSVGVRWLWCRAGNDILEGVQFLLMQIPQAANTTVAPGISKILWYKGERSLQGSFIPKKRRPWRIVLHLSAVVSGRSFIALLLKISRISGVVSTLYGNAKFVLIFDFTFWLGQRRFRLWSPWFYQISIISHQALHFAFKSKGAVNASIPLVFQRMKLSFLGSKPHWTNGPTASSSDSAQPFFEIRAWLVQRTPRCPCERGITSFRISFWKE